MRLFCIALLIISLLKTEATADAEDSTMTALRNFTVTFVRHGQTKANAAKIIQSRSQGELSGLGIRMAQSLGVYMKEEIFTKAYTSDLKRCSDTTSNILKNLRSPPSNVIKYPLLRERDYGDLENESTKKILEIHAKTGGRRNAIPIPGGEPFDQVLNRTGKFFNELCEMADKSDSENVLVVTHSAWISTLLDWLLAQESFELVNYDEKRRIEAPKNTATTRIIIHKKANTQKRKIQFVHIHDISHLTAAGITPP